MWMAGLLWLCAMGGKELHTKHAGMRSPHGTVTITLADWDTIRVSMKRLQNENRQWNELQPLLETLLSSLVFDTGHQVDWILEKIREFNTHSPVRISHDSSAGRLVLVFPDDKQTDNDS
jgi:hypothetical protein